MRGKNFNDVTVRNTLEIEDKITTVGATGSFTIENATGPVLTVNQTGLVFNSDNDDGTDFIIKSDGNDVMFAVDSSADTVLFGAATSANSYLAVAASGVIVNNVGNATTDFTVESDSTAKALFVDASANIVTIGGDGTAAKAVLGVDAATASTGVVINNEGLATADFRAEGSAAITTIAEDPANLLFADAGLCMVGIGESVPTSLLHVAGAAGSAKTVVTIEQGDDDETFIDFVGTSAADQTKSISTVNGDGAASVPLGYSSQAGWAFIGMIKIDVNGTAGWLPYYVPETS